MLFILCILVCQLASILGTTFIPITTTMSPPTTRTSCVWNGKVYNAGEQFSPDPCMFCHCDFSGRPQCAIADCAIPPCLDAVSKPDQCCPVCPNGSNCRAPDGTIISEGETYTTSKGAMCKCPGHGGHFWGAQNAICAIQLTPPPTAVVKIDDLAVS